MTNAQIERILDRLVERLPVLLTAEGYGRDTCILHTRVAVDALRAAGVRARPLAVQVAVFNQAYADAVNALGRMPLEGDPVPDDIWTVHIGYGAPENAERPGFDGHVIAVVNERYAVDLTIDQARRPHKNIDCGPHWWAMRPGFTAGEAVEVFTHAGTYVRYEAMPEERSFLNAGDWQLPTRHQGRIGLPTQRQLGLT